MEEQLFKYGQYELDKTGLIRNILKNLPSFTKHYMMDSDLEMAISQALSEIVTGIQNNTIISDEIGNLTDTTNSWVDDETHRLAIKYFKTVANAYGEHIEKNRKKEGDIEGPKDPVKEKFDYAKHGFNRYFLEQTNPQMLGTSYKKHEDFVTDFSNTLDSWRNQYSTDTEAISAFSNLLDSYKTKHLYQDLDFSTYGMTSDSYLDDISSLLESLKDGSIDNVDEFRLGKLGLSNYSRLFKKDVKLVDPTIKPEGKPEDKLTNKPDDSKIESEVMSIKMGNMSVGDYWNNIKLLGLGESDEYRLAGLGLDILSILNPEPISAAGLGYASDYLNLKADNLDGTNDTYWDDFLNFGVSTLGAIPAIGDFAKLGNLGKKVLKAAGVLTKLLAAPGVVMAAVNHELLKQSVDNLINNDFTVDDLQNVWTIIQLALGGFNASKSFRGKRRAETVDALNEQALVVSVKNKGKTEDYTFTGEHKTRLEELQNDPNAFKLYLRDNFEGFDTAELASVKTTKGDLDWENRKYKIFPTRKESTQTVKTTVEPIRTEKLPLYTRARNYSKSREANSPKIKSDSPKQSIPETSTPSLRRFNPLGEEITNLEVGKIYKDENGNYHRFKEDNTWELIPKEDVGIFNGEYIHSKGANEALVVGAGFVGSEDKLRQIIEGNASKAEVEVKPDIESLVSPKKSADYERRKTEYGEEIADLLESIENLGLSNRKRKSTIGKLDAELKKLKGNKSKSLDDDTLQILQEIINSNSSGKGYFSDLFDKTTRAFLKLFPNKDLKEIRQMLFNKGFYKQGGILKMLGGDKIPDWFIKLQGKNISLGNWNAKLNNSNRGNLRKDLNASTLETVYNLNDAYTLDTTAVGSDIMEAFTNMGFSNNSFTGDLGNLNFNSAITTYNEKIKQMTDFLNKAYEYNLQDDSISNFANLYKSMYASRNLGNYEKDYDLGFNNGISDVYGSNMFHRRVDVYEKEFDLLTDLEKKNRIFNIADGRYVYKNADGTINAIDLEEATRILNYKEPENPENETGGEDEGTLMKGKGDETKIPKEEELKTKQYTGKPDYLGIAGSTFNYFNALRHNRKLLELANQAVPMLYDPIEHYRYVLGDLASLNQGQINYAKLRSMASKPITSDANLQLASQLEAENKGLEYLTLGQMLDNQAIKESSERAWEQEKLNKENRYNIAMKNRENMWQIDREKLLAKANYKRANYESTTNFVNEIKTYLTQSQKEKLKEQELIQNKAILDQIRRSPATYITGWNKEHQALYNRYLQGDTSLTTEELAKIRQILDWQEQAYYWKMFPGTYSRPNTASIVIPDWNDVKIAKRDKKGGKLGYKEVNTIISFLKESNNNYNKAIDRSVRGLYNHIKEQKRNKRK